MKTARVHHAARRRGGVAARGARAAAGDAGDRFHARRRRPAQAPNSVDSFPQGPRESGLIDGQNVAVEYHWAEGRYDRLPAFAADLVERRVAVHRGWRRTGCGAGGKSRNDNDSCRVRQRRRSG